MSQMLKNVGRGSFYLTLESLVVVISGLLYSVVVLRWLGPGWFGIYLDADKNKIAKGEARIDASNSRVQLWIMPTNEELIVAKQSRDCLKA